MPQVYRVNLSFCVFICLRVGLVFLIKIKTNTYFISDLRINKINILVINAPKCINVLYFLNSLKTKNGNKMTKTKGAF